MDKEFIEDLARKYANASEFRSDHKYDWQSVFKGYIEGFETCLRLIEAKKAEDDIYYCNSCHAFFEEECACGEMDEDQ